MKCNNAVRVFSDNLKTIYEVVNKQKLSFSSFKMRIDPSVKRTNNQTNRMNQSNEK